MGRTTISLSSERKAEFDAAKPDDMSGDEFIGALIATWRDDGANSSTDSDADLDDVLGRLDDLEASIPKQTANEIARKRR
jgi:hypothetical protein